MASLLVSRGWLECHERGLRAAWSFVGLRIAHTLVHLGGNRVPRRFAVFALSVLALAGLWLHLMWGLMS